MEAFSFPKFYLWKWNTPCTTPKVQEECAMEARAKLFGHPIHQMLIVFPLGLLGASLFFDVIAMAAARPALLQASFYMIASGILAGLVAAVFGLVDFLSIPNRT